MQPAPARARANNGLSPVDVDDVLSALNDLLPTINLEVTPRRVIQQMLADHLEVTWDDIHVHAQAIRDKNFDVNSPNPRAPSGETGDVRNKALPEPDDE